MQLLKWLSAVVLACAMSLCIFSMIQRLLLADDVLKPNTSPALQVDFLSRIEESQVQLKRRTRPPKQLQKPQAFTAHRQSSQQSDFQPLAMDIPLAEPQFALDEVSRLSDAVAGMGFGDSDVIPLVRIDAMYPRKALQKRLEGFVTARLEINAQGSVDKVTVVDSKPRGVFEREAIRALYKYRFKPKMLHGEAVAQVASQTIEFSLGDAQ